MGMLPKEQLRQLIKENDIKDVNGIYDTLKNMFKDVLQEMLEAEMDATLGYAKNEAKNKETTNIRNGYSSKNLKTKYGNIEMDIPRDRNSEFEPKIVPKYQRDVSGIEDKVIALYARGMSTRDIHDQVKDIYGIEVSSEMVSKITEKIVPEIKEWQSRPLEIVYPFVFIDAIHVFCKRKFPNVAKIFPQAPVGIFYVNLTAA